MKNRSLRSGASICGALTLALAAVASPAKADDLLPGLPAAAAIPATPATDVVPTVAVTPPVAVEPAPVVETPVVLPVSTPIPPVVAADSTPVLPDSAAPSSAPAAPPAPSAPQTRGTTTQSPVTPTQPDPPATPAANDTGNTTGDNPNSITSAVSKSAPTLPAGSSSIPASTLIWNWSWNCDPSDVPVTNVPVGQPGTTIIWNWHWSCGDVAPPPLSVTGGTLCIACNIAISVRIASPGDSGDVLQTISSVASAAATNAASIVQDALQAAGQAAGPHVAVVPAPADPVNLPATQVLIDAGPAVLASMSTSWDEDSPQHGAPTFGRGAIGNGPASVRGQQPRRTGFSFVAGAELTAARGALARTDLERPERGPRAGGAAAQARTSPPPLETPPGAPSTPFPLPLVVVPAGLAGHDTGSSASGAMAATGLLSFFLVFLFQLRQADRAARGETGQARPHPPG